MKAAIPDQPFSPPKPAVFYDGACPLCRREISVYKRRDKGEALDWVDVSACDLAALPGTLTRGETEARFHVRSAKGEVLSGAAAFAEVWTHTPGFRTLGRIAKVPVITVVLEGIYRGFLIVRPQMQGLARWMETRA